MRIKSSLLLLAFAALTSPGCETFDGPPEAYLPDAMSGLLSDPSAPLRIRFTKPIAPETLKLYVVPLEVDAQDHLPDERGIPDTDSNRVLNPLFLHNPLELSADYNGTSTLEENNTLFTATLRARLPVGQRLAVLIEPGLANTTNGLITNVRRRLSFALDFKCSNKGTQIATSGPYFFLLNVETPLALQVQLYAWLDIDPITGAFVGQFSNADRLPNAGKCPSACASDEVCQTSPTPKCVLASEKAQSVDDYVDFFPQDDALLGYGVSVQGCIEDQGSGTAALATAPANLGIKSPPVSIDALTVVSVFKADENGTLRGTGSGSADNARLGSGNLGRAVGTVLVRSLTEAEAPANIPRPPSAQ